MIPFIVGFFDLLLSKNNLFFAVNLPKYYGSIILTFLGAIYWGTILNLFSNTFIPEKTKLIIIIWSVTPSILAITILCIKSNYSILVLSMAFLLCQLFDELGNKYLLFPSWYLPLRRILTLVVVLVLICSYFIIET